MIIQSNCIKGENCPKFWKHWIKGLIIVGPAPIAMVPFWVPKGYRSYRSRPHYDQALLQKLAWAYYGSMPKRKNVQLSCT